MAALGGRAGPDLFGEYARRFRALFGSSGGVPDLPPLLSIIGNHDSEFGYAMTRAGTTRDVDARPARGSGASKTRMTARARGHGAMWRRMEHSSGGRGRVCKP